MKLLTARERYFRLRSYHRGYSKSRNRIPQWKGWPRYMISRHSSDPQALESRLPIHGGLYDPQQRGRSVPGIGTREREDVSDAWLRHGAAKLLNLPWNPAATGRTKGGSAEIASRMRRWRALKSLELILRRNWPRERETAAKLPARIVLDGLELEIRRRSILQCEIHFSYTGNNVGGEFGVFNVFERWKILYSRIRGH